MDSFERAHVPRKESSKNKSNYMKKHLKQMLRAYQTGNNEEIKKSAEIALRYDAEEMSLSDYSELSVIKEVDNSMENSNNTRANSSVSDHSNKSNVSDAVNSIEDSLESTASTHSYVEEMKSSSEFNLSMYEDSYSRSSSISISSSLVSKDSEDDNVSTRSSDFSSDENFDPDGTLAAKILEKLRKDDKLKKFTDKVSRDNLPSQDITHSILKTDKTSSENKLVKKLSNIVEIKDLESIENAEYIKKSENVDELDMCQDSDDDQSSISPYISVSATDMNSYSLSDIVGDYVHPTSKNLPSEKQNTHDTNIFQAETMDVDEIDNIIPEDLVVEDLNLDTISKDSLRDISAFEDTTMTDIVSDNDSTDDTARPMKIYYGKDSYIILMKHPSELYIHGKVNVSAISGEAEVFGYTLKERSIEVYAPYCYYAHCLKTVGNPSIFKGLFGKLTSAGLSVSEAKEIVRNIGDCDAIIRLNKLESRSMDFVDNNFYTTDLFSKRNDTTPSFLKKASEDLGCSLYLNPHKRYLDEKQCWEQVVSCGMDQRSRGIICGGKDTGKSTFLRYYVNRLLSKGPVLVIDLDPGQAEFTIPGSLSVTVVDKPLIGPNFTHLRSTDKSLNIGLINTMDNPALYVSAVTELLEYCQSNGAFRELPWIVNTMGMCNDLGLKFITYIVTKLQPTFLYQIDSKAAKNKFDSELDSYRIKDLYRRFSRDRLIFRNELNSNLEYTFIIEKCEDVSLPQSVTKVLKPRDERYLNILAYFGTLLESHSTQGLLEIVPYEVNLKNLNIALNVKIPEEALTKVINGKIIALCQLTSGDKGKVFTLADKALLCHGHGLIRGVDNENNVLYILTPMSMDKLGLVDTLVYSDWMPEVTGTERQLPGGTAVPYRAPTIHQHKLMSPPRRRFNPLQLLKMSRNS